MLKKYNIEKNPIMQNMQIPLQNTATTTRKRAEKLKSN